MIVKKGLCLLLCLLQASGLVGWFEKLTEFFGRNRLQNSDQRWVLASNEFCRDDAIGSVRSPKQKAPRGAGL
jgi:hypothetical protein